MADLTAIVIESSYVIRKGWTQILRSFDEIRNIYEFAEIEECLPLLPKYHPDLVLYHSTRIHQEIGSYLSGKEIVKIFWVDISPEEHLKEEVPKWSDLSLSPLLSREKIRQSLEQILQDLGGETDQGNHTELSQREITVLKLISRGLTNKEIADKMYISPHTVITHRKNITRKLGIKTVAGLTVYAILNKLVSLDEIES